MQSYSSKYLLLLFVFAILVLLISIVGVSFAYSFYGEKNSEYFAIKMGTVALNFKDSNNILIDNSKIVSDDFGVTSSKYRKNFQVLSNVDAVYDVGIKPQSSKDFDKCIKVAVLDKNENVVLGNTDNFGKLKSGVLVNSLQDHYGENNLITDYALFSDKISATEGTKEYVLVSYFSGCNESNSLFKTLNNKNISYKMNIIASQK